MTSVPAIRQKLTQQKFQGITLVELLLVLVLLVVVTSLALPLVEGSFTNLRLRRGSDQVLAAINDARSHSIESGKIYQLRFEPSGSKYLIDPWSETQESEPLVNDSTTSTLWSLEATLPEQVSFSAGKILTTNEVEQRQVTSLLAGETLDWSAPIFFFPDGSTSNASLLLQNDKELYQRITLRGLTGVARVSELLSELEADRLQSQ